MRIVFIGTFSFFLICDVGLAFAQETRENCEALKKQQGWKAYALCMRDVAKNYLPGAGPGPGMAMDEFETQAGKIADGICNGPDTVCDGEPPGKVIGTCTCK